jgi:hypothetical protein
MHDDQQIPPPEDAHAAGLDITPGAHADHAAEEKEAAEALDQVATKP